MKFIAYIFAAVFFGMVILTPFVELFGIFVDTVRINSVVLTSTRAAVQIAEADGRDTKRNINIENFKKGFKETFTAALGLYSDYSPKNLEENSYNEFEVTITPLYRDSTGEILEYSEKYNICKIEVETEYKFKTKLMQRFAESFSSPYIIRIKRNIKLEIEV